MGVMLVMVIVMVMIFTCSRRDSGSGGVVINVW